MYLPIIFITGHIFGALLFYCFHRFIFHGKLGKIKLLSSIRRIHTRHHAKPDSLERALFPKWSWFLIAISIATIGLVSISFAIGFCSFFPVYSYRHRKAHDGSDAHWARHHMHHHKKNPHVNFGGIYPILDILFGTNEEVPDK